MFWNRITRPGVLLAAVLLLGWQVIAQVIGEPPRRISPGGEVQGEGVPGARNKVESTGGQGTPP